MHRMLQALVVLVCLAVGMPAQAQQTQKNTRNKSTSSAHRGRLDARPGALPAATIPFQRPPLRYLADGSADLGHPGDSRSEGQILRRLSRIYAYQAKSLDAQADADAELAEDQLELAMTELSTLLQQPDIMERPRFRELYRTVISEYERFYGVSPDTLSLQFGDIFQFRADMFAALNEVDEPLLEDVMMPTITPIETVFPMTMNRLVEQSIAYLLRSPDRHLYHWLGRSETYFPMIEQVLREEGVPDELKYLAMIESGLNPRARSWAQAGGMWQFITATGSAYGLQTNGWVDERLDPEKATRAAARHLKDLYELFDHDWQLALAGYNCSPSRIKRAMARAESRLGRRATFWDIYDDIPRETRNYVPMFIATSLVASNPEAFDVDMNRVRPGPKYSYHYVPVHGQMPISTIADLAGTDEETIRALNPELRRSATPPTQRPYYVRLPLGTYETFAAGYAHLPKQTRQAVGSDYTVRRGDTLSKIARQHGVSVQELMRENNLRSTTLRVGQRLDVPGSSFETRPVTLVDLTETKAYTVEYGARIVRPITADTPARLAANRRPTTSAKSGTPVVRTSTAAPEPAEAKAAPARTHETGETRIVYRVRRGDNLTAIARKYGVSVDDLRQWNSLRSNQLAVGQRLHLYEANDRAGESTTTA